MRLIIMACVLAGCGQLLLEELNRDAGAESNDATVDSDPRAGDTTIDSGEPLRVDGGVGDGGVGDGGEATDTLSDALPILTDTTGDAATDAVADAGPPSGLVGASTPGGFVVDATQLDSGRFIAANDDDGAGLVYFFRAGVVWANRFDRGPVLAVASSGDNAIVVGRNGTSPFLGIGTAGGAGITQVNVLEIAGDLRDVDADPNGFVAVGSGNDGLVVTGDLDGGSLQIGQLTFSGNPVVLESVLVQGSSFVALAYDVALDRSYVGAFSRSSFANSWVVSVRNVHGTALREDPAGNFVMLAADSVRIFRPLDGAFVNGTTFPGGGLVDYAVVAGRPHLLFTERVGGLLEAAQNDAGFTGDMIPYANGVYVQNAEADTIAGSPVDGSFVQLRPLGLDTEACPITPARTAFDRLSDDLSAGGLAPRYLGIKVVVGLSRTGVVRPSDFTDCR